MFNNHTTLVAKKIKINTNGSLTCLCMYYAVSRMIDFNNVLLFSTLFLKDEAFNTLLLLFFFANYSQSSYNSDLISINNRKWLYKK